jgi:hypothetical protein
LLALNAGFSSVVRQDMAKRPLPGQMKRHLAQIAGRVYGQQHRTEYVVTATAPAERYHSTADRTPLTTAAATADSVLMKVVAAAMAGGAATDAVDTHPH